MQAYVVKHPLSIKGRKYGIGATVTLSTRAALHLVLSGALEAARVATTTTPVDIANELSTPAAQPPAKNKRGKK